MICLFYFTKKSSRFRNLLLYTFIVTIFIQLLLIRYKFLGSTLWKIFKLFPDQCEDHSISPPLCLASLCPGMQAASLEISIPYKALLDLVTLVFGVICERNTSINISFFTREIVNWIWFSLNLEGHEPESALCTVHWGRRRGKRSVALFRLCTGARHSLLLTLRLAASLPGVGPALPLPGGVPVGHVQSLQGPLDSVLRGQDLRHLT